MKNKELIISLIADDMVNYKLVSGLEQINLEAHYYFLKLSETIFELMRFQDDQAGEDAFEYYMSRLYEAKNISVTYERTEINALALDIYTELERRSHAK